MTNSGAEAKSRIAIVFGSEAGVGGLGHQVSSAISGVALGCEELLAMGPGPGFRPWSLPGGTPKADWLTAPSGIPSYVIAYSWLRYRPGFVTLLHDRRLGRWAADQLERLHPQSCYLFTQRCFRAQ